MSTDNLATFKIGLILPICFKEKLSHITTNYYWPIIPLITKLWKEIFFHGQCYYIKDKTLYNWIKAILEKAREDLWIKI